MSLIVCDQRCRHQQEGYCALNQVTQLTGLPGAKCGYFEEPQTEAPLSTEGGQRLTDAADWY